MWNHRNRTVFIRSHCSLREQQVWLLFSVGPRTVGAPLKIPEIEASLCLPNDWLHWRHNKWAAATKARLWRASYFLLVCTQVIQHPMWYSWRLLIFQSIKHGTLSFDILISRKNTTFEYSPTRLHKDYTALGVQTVHLQINSLIGIDSSSFCICCCLNKQGMCARAAVFCQICDWPVLDLIIISSSSIIPVRGIMSERTWETVPVPACCSRQINRADVKTSLRRAKSGVAREEADRRDIVLSGCAVFVSIILLSASLHLWERIIDNKKETMTGTVQISLRISL